MLSALNGKYGLLAHSDGDERFIRNAITHGDFSQTGKDFFLLTDRTGNTSRKFSAAKLDAELDRLSARMMLVFGAFHLPMAVTYALAHQQIKNERKRSRSAHKPEIEQSKGGNSS